MIDNFLFKFNRKRLQKLLSLLSSDTGVLFYSNPVEHNNILYTPNKDLFYLTGINQDNVILLVTSNQEILFIQKITKTDRIWEGKKLTKDEARKISGIKNVYYLTEFETVLQSLFLPKILSNLNKDTDGLMSQLRQYKSDIEIDQIKKACQITENTFREILKKIRVDINEKELEAFIWYDFIRNNATQAYYPIIASGIDNCIIHYTDNNKFCRDGDLLLMDFGASYNNWASDMTRTVPVNGKFTKRQKEVYNSVLSVMKDAIKLLVVNKSFEQYQNEVDQLMKEQLIKLNLIKKNQKIDKYFMHGVSHLMGLDVHDVGNYDMIEEGMVFTCEPAIYIPEEGFGIRIENDILVTATGQIDLMESIPIEAEEIEDLMRSL